jgi:hypothetical protein
MGIKLLYKKMTGYALPVRGVDVGIYRRPIYANVRIF